ncbi:MAG: electron transfer flavoprotein subunit beta/FixA family protein [Angelakisella sp.]
MNILVCVKQVPGTSQVEVDPVTGVLKRDGVASKLNPYDLYALETAMTLHEQHGGTVRTVTMGPMQAKAAILETVYMGAQGGLLVSDRKFAGADVLATSYTLSQAVNSMGDFDLLLCGKQTTDGDTAQVGAEMAEFLGIPHANNVLSIVEVQDGRVTVRVNLESHIATQSMPMPCLLCMDGDINTPRLPSYKRKKVLQGDPVAVISLADFADRDERHYGLSGSPTQVERIFPPEKNNSKEMLCGSNQEKADALADILHQRKFI